MVAKEVLMVRVIMAVMGPVVEQIMAKEPIMVAAVVVLVQMEEMHLFQQHLGRPRQYAWPSYTTWPGWGTRAGDGGAWAQPFHLLMRQ